MWLVWKTKHFFKKNTMSGNFNSSYFFFFLRFFFIFSLKKKRSFFTEDNEFEKFIEVFQKSTNNLNIQAMYLNLAYFFIFEKIIIKNLFKFKKKDIIN